MNTFKSGSLWRKWDIHIHTPFSSLNNQFGSDFDKYIYNLYTKAIENKVYCIGITDYFLIEGYEKIQEELKNTEKIKEIFKDKLVNDSNYIQKINSIALFPNIEFRIDTLISYSNGNQKKAQVHVILDNDLTISQIKNDFLCNLHLVTDISIDGLTSVALTRENLEKLGSQLKKDQPDFNNGKSDFEVGCNQAYINFDELKKLLEERFKNKYILLIVEDDITNISWNNQGHLIRKKLYSASNGIMSSNSNTIKWGLSDNTKKEFSSFKPCFWGSDAHNFEKMFKPDNDRFCWIKGDMTFNGLKQVLINPTERIYIGPIPPQLDRIEKNKSNIIKSIFIEKNCDAKNSCNWFSFTEPLSINPSMTTIIGNKGSGKSALADIISLAGNSKNIGKASFINDQRFKKLPENYAGDYYSNVAFIDHHNLKVERLDKDVELSSVEFVQYLPQKFIEEVCSGIGEEFQNEIDNAIFSYLELNEREGCLNLNELIKNKTLANTTKFQGIRNKLELLNNDIYCLENKKVKSYINKVNENLSNLEQLLSRHNDNKPTPIEKPKEEDNSNITLITKIEEECKIQDESYSEIEDKLSTINTNLTRIDTFLDSSDYKINQAKQINDEYIELAETLKIEPSKFVTIKVNDIAIKEFKQKLIKEKNKYEEAISSIDVDLGFVSIPNYNDFTDLKEKVNSIKSISTRLYIYKTIKENVIKQTSILMQRYQKYISDLKVWDDQRKKIIGEKSDNQDGTISYYKKEKEYIENKLEDELKLKYDERLMLIENLYNLYVNNCSILEKIYLPVENRLKNILSKMDEKITFEVQIVVNANLKNDLLNMIDQRIQGAFHGKTEGTSYLNDIIASTKFENKMDAIKFVEKIFDDVTESIDLSDNLLKNDRLAFYNYLCDLNYLSGKFMLKLGNKNLKELSPGERGIVLLIFYLTLNKSNIPLIIDQPEDNLDNQSVYDNLVPCILEAKKQRQIIIVTHNPNIAIACDSEQIIYCNMDKKNNTISYESGSIENPVIRNHVINVLEGTMPAFDLRRQKYI